MVLLLCLTIRIISTRNMSRLCHHWLQGLSLSNNMLKGTDLLPLS